jgi:tetratricopeptide (TPR) repeat protein
MTKYIIFLATVVSLVFTTTDPSFATKDLITIAAGQNEVHEYHRALNNLDKALESEPKNPELHFQRGIAFINLNNWDQARKSFTACRDLKIAYHKKIAKFYFEFGLVFMNKNKTDQAIKSFQTAQSFNPGSLGNLASRLFSQGMSAISQGRIRDANKYLSVATGIDSSLKKETSNLFFNAGKLIFSTTNVKDSLFLFQLAKKHSCSHDEQIANMIIECAKVNIQDDQLLAKLRNELSYYLTEADANKRFPVTHMDLQLNKWYKTKTLAKGEISDVWVRWPPGQPVNLEYGVSDSKVFAIVLKDGTEYIISPSTKGNLPTFSSTYFKFKAYEDQIVAGVRAYK